MLLDRTTRTTRLSLVFLKTAGLGIDSSETCTVPKAVSQKSRDPHTIPRTPGDLEHFAKDSLQNPEFKQNSHETAQNFDEPCPIPAQPQEATHATTKS